MLGNSIALLTLAFMLASEGRRTEGRWRAGLYTLGVVLALVALTLSQIVEALPVVGTTLSAIFGSPLAWFLLLMGLFFVLRPFWGRNPTAQASASPTHDVASGSVGLDERLSAVEQMCPDAADQHFWNQTTEGLSDLRQRVERLEETNRAIVDDYQRMLGIDAKFSDALDKHKDASRNDLLTASANHSVLQEEVRALEKVLEERHERIRSSLYAIYARDHLTGLATQINESAAALYGRLHSGERYSAEDWVTWSAEYDRWWSLMSQWWSTARFYIANSREVLVAPDNKYSGEWKVEDAQFPNSEAVRVFKKFRIIQTQWEERQDELQNNLFQVAFMGQREVDVRHGQSVEQ